MPNQELTPEQQADSNARQNEFNEKYKALMDEYQMVVIPIPAFVPQPNGTFTVNVTLNLIDKKYLNIPATEPKTT